MSTETATICHACGAQLAPRAPFCGTCGTTLPPASRASAALVAAPVVAAPGARSASSATTRAATEPAPPGKRVLALVVDGAVGGAIVILAYLVMGAGAGGAVASGSEAAMAATFLGLLFVPSLAALAYGFGQLIWEGRAGLTIGNKAMGIQSVTFGTDQPPGFGHALLRRFVEGLGSFVFIGSFVIAYSAAWDPARRQGWQDKVANTEMVTGVRAGVARPAATAPAALPAAQWPGQAFPTPAPALAPIAAVPVPPSTPFAPVAPTPGGLIDAVPGMSSAPPPPPAPPPTPVAPPAAPTTELEDLELTAIRAPRPLHAGAYRLQFDTGEALTVTGTGLVGRNPGAREGESFDHLIPIADPALSVSKTHLAFGVGKDGFWILDRGSTNGTRTVTAEGARSEVPSGTRVTVPVGSTVEFGDRRFTVAPS